MKNLDWFSIKKIFMNYFDSYENGDMFSILLNWKEKMERKYHIRNLKNI